MKIVETVAELRELLDSFRRAGKKIGFVPTMGHLHAGHLSLVKDAQTCTDVSVVSIFVNPLQFNNPDDLDKYPRTFDDDCAMLRELGTDVLLFPGVDQIYPQGMETCTKVEVPLLGERLEGEKRPGHFTGVSTVVNKLLNMVQPDAAVFGKKDLQQLLIIQKMVRDLDMPVEIRAGETMREADNLAMSSRNTRIAVKDREKAALIYSTLTEIAERVRAGGCDFRELELQSMDKLNAAGFRAEYVEICDTNTLLPADETTQSRVVLAAAWLGEVRLIDNLWIDEAGNLN